MHPIAGFRRLVCCRLFRCLGRCICLHRSGNIISRLVLISCLKNRVAILILVLLTMILCLVLDIDQLYRFDLNKHHFYRPLYIKLSSSRSLPEVPMVTDPWVNVNRSPRTRRNHRYLVYSPQCQLVKMPLFDEETGPLYHNQSYRFIECPRTLLTIVRVNYTAVHIPAIDLPDSKLDCYAQSVERDLVDSVRIEPTRYGPLQSVTNFPGFSAVRVECFQPMFTFDSFVSRSLIDSRIIPLVPYRPTPKSTKSQSSDPNVLLLGIDSVSFLNFCRHFRQTEQFFQSHHFVPQYGFTKVGDNTFPNLVALLTGHHYTDYWNSSLPPSESDRPFDTIPAIWKRFSARGYLTSLIEDMPSFSLFNYNRAGFNKTPTDYYLRPVSLLIDQHLSHKFCYQDRLTIEFYYSWILSQMEALRIRGQPFLTISHLADLTHNEHLNAGIADRPLFTLLSEIFRRNLNHNTVIVVFSDHGIRFGRLRQTRSGFDEERLPFLYVYVPDNGDFFMSAKRVRQIMALNSHRLTSHFDIHATLRHILDNRPPTDEPYGRSLLTPIPINRTCSEAGINPEWCLCTEYRPISSNEPTARSLARFVVWKINRLLSSFRNKCSILRLSQVVLVKIETRGADSNNPKKSKLAQRFLVQLKTRPGNALLETTVERLPRQTVPSINKHRKKRFSIVGDISRLNRYSPQASCIHNSVLEKYCHCNKRNSTIV